MNYDKLKDISEQREGKRIASPDDLIEALIEAGANPDDRAEIMDAVNTYADPLELGKSPEGIYYAFAQEWNRRREALEEQRRLNKTDDAIARAEAWITDYRSNRETLSTKDLRDRTRDIVEAVGELDRTVNPPRVDYSELLAPKTREGVVARIKNKPPAHVTGYKLPGDTAGSIEELRFQTGALSIVAAPTGHGKTTFLIDLILDAAERYPDRRHWLFSYEEDDTAILLKALSAFSGVEYSRSNRRTLEAYYRGDTGYFGKYNDNGTTGTRLSHFEKVEPRFWELVENGTLNIVQADYPAGDLMDAIREVAKDRAGLIAVDYLQLLYRNDEEAKYLSRQEELKRVCLDFKDTAIESGLAIVAAAQFNREVRYPGAMELQRIADASDIEKAANKVIGLWNGDKKPGTDKEAPKDLKEKRIDEGRVYLEVLKARDERSGVSGLYAYNGNVGRIEKSPLPDSYAGAGTTEPQKNGSAAGNNERGKML